MKRSMKNFISLLEKEMKEHGFLFFVKNGELYRLDTVSAAPLEKMGLEKAVEIVNGWMDEEAREITGLSLAAFDLQDIATIEAFESLTGDKSEDKREKMEELILGSLMLKQMAMVPERVACRYMQGTLNDEIADMLAHAIRHAGSVLADSCYGCQDVPRAVDAYAARNKNGSYQAALEFEGSLAEDELYALLAMSPCVYCGDTVNIIPVKRDGFGSAELYIQSWEEKNHEENTVSVPVSGGRLVAEAFHDPDYPSIAVTFCPDDGSQATGLALVEESDKLLRILSYADTQREDPDIIRCSYNPDMLAHIIYGLCGADEEGIPFAEFCRKQLADRDYMKEVLPENLYGEYEVLDFSDVYIDG